MKLRSILATTAAALLLAPATPALAQIAAITFTGGSVSNFAGAPEELPLTGGWSFTTSQAFTVTALGFWDQNGDGLLTSHQVGIFNNSDDALLTSAMVPSGTAALLGINNFRYVSIADFVLAPGSYTMGALLPAGTPTDDWVFGDTTVISIPGLTYGGGFRGPDGGGFVRPTLSPSGGRFGPNMLVIPTGGPGPIPEPATWAMMIVGFGIVGGVLRTRRRVPLSIT